MATALPYILARTLKEGHQFARGVLGLPNGRYRIVNSAGTLKSVRNADLYLVPGWEKRYDRFAIQTALRWTRMNKIDVAEGGLEQQDPRGPLTDEVLDLAYAEHAVRSGEGAPGIQIVSQPDGLDPPGEQLAISTDFFDDVSNGDDMVSEGGPADPEPESEPLRPGRRRSRCKECGSLRYKGDPCPGCDT